LGSTRTVSEGTSRPASPSSRSTRRRMTFVERWRFSRRCAPTDSAPVRRVVASTISVIAAPLVRIRNETLETIAVRGIPVPTYDRSGLLPRILHLGVGGFHRSHLALYTHELAEAGNDWGIRGRGRLPT